MFVGALAFSLLAAEIALRLFYPQQMSGSLTYLDEDDDLLNRKNGRAQYQVRDRPGHIVYYQFNSFRERGHEEPSPTATRVLILGDSFTFGWGLEEEKTYVASLQRNLDRLGFKPRVQLLNGAVGGWGTADEVAYLQKYGDQVAPHALIVDVSVEDFGRAIRSNIFRIDEATGEAVRINTARRGSSIKKLLQDSEAYNWLLEHSHLVQFTRNAIVLGGGIGRMSVAGQDTAGEGQQKAEQAIAHALFGWMKHWCDARKIPFAVITNGWTRYPWLAGEMQGLGIQYFDLGQTIRPVILREGLGKFEIPRDGHPNEEGARLIGDAAWDALEPWFKALNDDYKRTHAE